MRLSVLLLALFLAGCVPRARMQISKPLPEVHYIQFGSEILVEEGRGFRFEGTKEVKRVSGGWLLEPEDRCLKLMGEKGSRSLCLKPVPPVYPHLKVLKVDSYAVDLKILSLFPRIALFAWEKGRPPDLRHPRVFPPGVHSLRGLSLGKTYLLSGAVILGPDLYGPLSPPLEVAVKDEEPPRPPSGGGYFLKGQRIILVWDPSPSRDVVGYVVEREGQVFKVKGTSFKERANFKKKVVIYSIKALDGSGHESRPLRLKVVFPF